ncbi:integrase [Granulicella aggregans]|uniref:Integrase n=1 Tax=Granulicella aggregans TaxID=474949 RepID=A0A7W8E3Y6_9BACT|nr:site-specific integrase [Granulicella aggregans]MBB5058067.1 integrase [Granulicella aggregans]
MPKRTRKHVARKTVLRLPDLDHSKTSVLNSLSPPRSRRNYKFAMEQFIDWYCSEPRLALNRTVVLRFRLHLESLGLAAGTINQRLAAVRRLAYEAADSGLLSPELAAGIRRVKGVKQLGCRAGNWLNKDQARLLLEKANGSGLRPVRDVAMISILLGCGLRRAELSALRRENIQIRQGHWAIVDLVGKGNHVRTVPMPIWVKGAVDRWLTAASVTTGRVFRAVSRHGTAWGNGISENVVWYVVRSCAQRLEFDHLAPHDLRRTCAKLCHVNGGELEQIQFLLGHASVLTTERCLRLQAELGRARERPLWVPVPWRGRFAIRPVLIN